MLRAALIEFNKNFFKMTQTLYDSNQTHIRIYFNKHDRMLYRLSSSLKQNALANFST